MSAVSSELSCEKGISGGSPNIMTKLRVHKKQNKYCFYINSSVLLFFLLSCQYEVEGLEGGDVKNKYYTKIHKKVLTGKASNIKTKAFVS